MFNYEKCGFLRYRHKNTGYLYPYSAAILKCYSSLPRQYCIKKLNCYANLGFGSKKNDIITIC